MGNEKKNITHSCGYKVSFSFLSLPEEQARAKHARILEIFRGALLRQLRQEEAVDEVGHG